MKKDAGSFLQWLCGPEGGGSTKRPWHVLEFAKSLDNSEGSIFWRIVTEEWSGFDLIPHAEFEKQFTRFSSTAPGIGGSEPLRLFRGQDAADPVGLSWTSSHAVAKTFAQGHRGILNKEPVLLKFVAHASEVAFKCDDRDEYEYVLLSRPALFRLSGAAG